MSKKIKEIKDQVVELQALFPNLKVGNITECTLDGGEGLVVIPKWNLIAKSYNDAVIIILDLIKEKRGLFNHVDSCLGVDNLSRSEHTKNAWKKIEKIYSDSDIMVISTQSDKKYKDFSISESQEIIKKNNGEFGLGMYEVAIILLINIDILNNNDDLWISCPGDIYNSSKYQNYSGVPCFGYTRDVLNIGISLINYKGIHSGSASAFIPQ